MEPAYVLALSTGLLGGFGHCIGMCGPLVASYALSHRPESAQPFSRTLAPHLFYNAGRIATYAAIGAAMGLSGSFLNVAGSFAGVQNCVALLAGVFMIIMGLGTSGIWGN
jgi:hypothetical protein